MGLCGIAITAFSVLVICDIVMRGIGHPGLIHRRPRPLQLICGPARPGQDRPVGGPSHSFPPFQASPCSIAAVTLNFKALRLINTTSPFLPDLRGVGER